MTTKNINIPLFVDVTVLNGVREEPAKININLVTYLRRTKVNKTWDKEKGRPEQCEATEVFFIDGASIYIKDDIESMAE